MLARRVRAKVHLSYSQGPSTSCTEHKLVTQDGSDSAVFIDPAIHHARSIERKSAVNIQIPAAYGPTKNGTRFQAGPILDSGSSTAIVIAEL